MVVVSREMVDGWAKYKIVVESVFKRGTENLQRGETSLWISPQGVICKCPKLRVGRRYLLLGESITQPIPFCLNCLSSNGVSVLFCPRKEQGGGKKRQNDS